VLLRALGWHVNTERVARIWRIRANERQLRPGGRSHERSTAQHRNAIY
jgi:hypothetical protein